MHSAPPSDRRHLAFLARLIIFHGTITLIAGAVVILEPVGDWSNYLIGGMITGHGALLGIWIAMGTRSTPWWLLGTAAGLFACAWGVRTTLPGLNAEVCAEVLLIQMVATCPLLLILRLLGLTIAEPSHHDDRHPRDRQFSLRSLFVWTAVVAILLSLIQTFPMTIFSGGSANPLRSATGLLLQLVGNGLIGMAVIWAVLGQGRTVLRISLLLGVTILPTLINFANIPWWHRALFFLVHTSVLAGSLWTFRLSGYRLRR